jgi:dephospho-CoA kinase
MIILGLTGSIGMGKTATARLFAEEGAPVWDADATVHALYAPGGGAVAPVGEAFPGAVHNGAVDRKTLSQLVHAEPGAFERLEALVHPLTAAARDAFIEDARKRGALVAVLDIPLLFETGAVDTVDAVCVVSAPEELQRKRVLERPGMDEATFAALLERQTPHARKVAHADFVIDTSRGFDAARDQVREVLARVSRPDFRPGRNPLDEKGEHSQ